MKRTYQDREIEIRDAVNQHNPPSKSQIKNVLNDTLSWTDQAQTTSTHYTFEQGVEAALKWILGITDEVPVEEKYTEQ